jgi:hypothetical protein
MRPLAALIATLCTLASARAAPPSRLEVELAWGVSGSYDLRSILIANTLLDFSAPINSDSALVVQWGFTIATGEPRREGLDATAFSAGNPLVGWAFRLADGLVLAPSATLPVARSVEDESAIPISTFALEGGIGLRGGLDRWLWRPDKLAFVLPVTWARWFEPLLLELNVKLGLLVPTRGTTADNDFSLQTTARLAWQVHSSSLWLAFTASGTWVPTEGGNDASLVIRPELRYVLEPYSHLEASLIMNLDAPLGPFWQPGRYWGVILGGSASL